MTVSKTLITDNGGSLTCADFSFKVDGGSAIPFEADCSNDVLVNAGNHTVTEVVTLVYATTCTNNFNANTNCNALLVANGGTRSCTVTKR